MSSPQSPPPLPSGSSVIHVVGAALIAQGRCLAARRSPTMSAPMMWEFPGGKVEPGESPPEALRRELLEELGVEVRVGAWVGRGEAQKGQRLIVLDVYRAVISSGTPAPVEHDDWGWFDPDGLASLGWAEPDIPIWPRVAALLDQGEG